MIDYLHSFWMIFAQYLVIPFKIPQVPLQGVVVFHLVEKKRAHAYALQVVVSQSCNIIAGQCSLAALQCIFIFFCMSNTWAIWKIVSTVEGCFHPWSFLAPLKLAKIIRGPSGGAPILGKTLPIAKIVSSVEGWPSPQRSIHYSKNPVGNINMPSNTVFTSWREMQYAA